MIRTAKRALLVTGASGKLGLRLSQHRAAIAAAVQADVEHVVYTSAPAPYPTQNGSPLDDHFWTEHALAATALDWTILRNHLYTDNLLVSLPNAVASGRLATSAGIAAPIT